MSVITKKRFQILILPTAEEFSALLQSILNELWPGEDAFVDVTVYCVHRQWFLEAFRSICSDFHDGSCLFLMRSRLRAWRSLVLHIEFQSCPFVHRDVSRFSEFLIIFLTVDGGISKVFAIYIEEHQSELFVNWLMQFLWFEETHFYFWDFASVRCSFYTQSCSWPVDQPNFFEVCRCRQIPDLAFVVEY